MPDIGEKTYLMDEDDIPVGKLEIVSNTQVATADGQTEFNIPFVSFDENKDALKVYKGRLTLHKDEDFTISEGKVVLVEGVNTGTTITMYMLKSVPQSDGETLISGSQIEPGTIPMDRLASGVVTCDTPIHARFNEDGSLTFVVTHDDGTEA